MDDPSLQQTPFIRLLASSSRPDRDKALASLTTFLSGRRSLPALELLKLHKGLFYCMWMSDRPVPQQKLADALAALLFVLPRETLAPYLRAFWQTMQREWTNIDVLRMEKFLLLTRRMVGGSLEVLRREAWERDSVKEMLGVWEEVPFNVQDMKVPNGMRFHCIDIFVDELERVGALDEAEAEKVPLDELLGPLRKLAKGSPTKAVRVKAKEALEDERLPGNEAKEEEDDGEDQGEEEWGGIED